MSITQLPSRTQLTLINSGGIRGDGTLSSFMLADVSILTVIGRFFLELNGDRIRINGLWKPVTFLPKQSQADVRNGIVVKDSPIFFNLLKGCLNAQGRAIRAVGGHGFHDIGDG